LIPESEDRQAGEGLGIIREGYGKLKESIMIFIHPAYAGNSNY
jgi:hypothetical protein